MRSGAFQQMFSHVYSAQEGEMVQPLDCCLLTCLKLTSYSVQHFKGMKDEDPKAENTGLNDF